MSPELSWEDRVPNRNICYEITGSEITVPAIFSLSQTMGRLVRGYNNGELLLISVDSNSNPVMLAAMPANGLIGITVGIDSTFNLYCIHIEYEFCPPDGVGFDILTTLKCSGGSLSWTLSQGHFRRGKGEPFNSMGGVLEIDEKDVFYERLLKRLCRRLFDLGS